MSNDNPIHNGPYQTPPRKPGKAVYVGSMQPFSGMAHSGQMHATPAARAIKGQQSLARRARKHFKGQ